MASLLLLTLFDPHSFGPSAKHTLAKLSLDIEVSGLIVFWDNKLLEFR